MAKEVQAKTLKKATDDYQKKYLQVTGRHMTDIKALAPPDVPILALSKAARPMFPVSRANGTNSAAQMAMPQDPPNEEISCFNCFRSYCCKLLL